MRTETNISRYDDNLCKAGDCLSNHLFSKHPNLLERETYPIANLHIYFEMNDI